MIQQNMAYPDLYPDENKIIPYSPRRKFGFTSPTTTYDTSNTKIIDLESMRNMPIDQIVELYRNGYRIEDMSPTIMSAQNGIYISTGTILLGVGLIALFYYLKSKGKI